MLGGVVDTVDGVLSVGADVGVSVDVTAGPAVVDVTTGTVVGAVFVSVNVCETAGVAVVAVSPPVPVVAAPVVVALGMSVIVTDGTTIVVHRVLPTGAQMNWNGSSALEHAVSIPGHAVAIIELQKSRQTGTVVVVATVRLHD